ncbi:hypothetical protein EJ110_NYTH03018 [Nymphaea thermarum]|nr:hypothetical protein EJ110_NYTH03018 [Nymphaea thermarum]
MCFATKCLSCGKTTWGGCGRHVTSVHSQIKAGQHCMCRPWPGVTPESSTGAPPHIAAAVDEQESKISRCVIQ